MKRKNCAGIGCSNRREVDSPSDDYCIECYKRMKYRYENWGELGRGVRALVHSSISNDRLRMRGFFALVHPEMTDEKADEITRAILAK